MHLLQKQKGENKLESIFTLINHYCEPVESKIKDSFSSNFRDSILLNCIDFVELGSSDEYFKNCKLALIGIPEDRNSRNIGANLAPNIIRKYLYSLSIINENLRIADLGNLKMSDNPQDTYYGLRDLSIELIEKDIVLLIIGGTQDLTYGNFLAYSELEKEVNIVSIDSKFDLECDDNGINSQNYMSKIVSEKAKFLYNFSNISYQKYLVSQEDIKLMDELLFDSYRLGHIRIDLKETETILRTANLVSFDIGAIKQADAPARNNPSPNGFFSNEACQISRYAGLSESVSSFGIYEVNPEFDNNYQTSNLAAQIIWHFIEGFSFRKTENFSESDPNFSKYFVSLNDIENQIIFYKSKHTERWWMKIPFPEETKISSQEVKIIPCSYKDYILASNNEIPDRLWKFIQKLD